MKNNSFVKILLAPFSLLYGFGVSLRAFSYRIQLQRSSRFDVPTICVGNLSMGGAGKSPHIEYLIRLLEPYISVGVLSRGYRRKTEGFLFVEPKSTALDVGDEPLQFKRKFPHVAIAVGERRAYAIPQMLVRYPDLQAILLDDAFQHLAVSPYLSVLLTEFSLPFTRDYLVPSGNLREGRQGYERAEIIVVTKCPLSMTLTDKEKFRKEIYPLPHQRIFFSYYDYAKPYQILDPSVSVDLDAETEVLLITGIARTDYLLDWLAPKVKKITTMTFEDHRLFTNYDVAQVKRLYDGMTTARKRLVLTTEKDATRLELHKEYLTDNQLPIYALPIEVKFHFNEGELFDKDIKQTLLDFKI
ncbi:MAG: tetraacyldisaccharide 4'-kinase [Saprospiraceae bacterium]|nr:tetraacyldisaccharide 4'-kinase [Saprospiraceae bacterium]